MLNNQFSLSNRVWFYLPFLLASAREREAKETEPQGPHPTLTRAAPLVFIFWFCVWTKDSNVKNKFFLTHWCRWATRPFLYVISRVSHALSPLSLPGPIFVTQASSSCYSQQSSVPSQGFPTALKGQLLSLDLVSTGIPSGHTLLFSMWLQKLLLKVFQIQRDGCTKGRIPRRRGTPIIDLFYILHSPSKSSTCQWTTGPLLPDRGSLFFFTQHSLLYVKAKKLFLADVWVALPLNASFSAVEMHEGAQGLWMWHNPFLKANSPSWACQRNYFSRKTKQ